MLTLSARIEVILNETGCSLEELAKAAGVSKANAGHWATGSVKSIKLEYAVGIQEQFGYSAVWLVLDKGSKVLLSDTASSDIPPQFLAIARRLTKLSPARYARVQATLIDQEQLDGLRHHD